MYQNPYQFMGSQAAMNPYQSMMQPAAPQMQVTKVNGAGGANAFSMGPNSSALLLDASGTMVWAVTTDGAGYAWTYNGGVFPPVTPATTA